MFAFDATHTDAEVLQHFRLRSRHFFFKYFHVADAPFHGDMKRALCGDLPRLAAHFINAAFCGAANTMRAKLFFA